MVRRQGSFGSLCPASGNVARARFLSSRSAAAGGTAIRGAAGNTAAA